jgi:hypothetical protein
METTKSRPEREKTDVRKFSHSSSLPFSPHRTWHIKVDHAVKWLKNILTGIEARLNMFEPC